MSDRTERVVKAAADLSEAVGAYCQATFSYGMRPSSGYPATEADAYHAALSALLRAAGVDPYLLSTERLARYLAQKTETTGVTE